MAKGLSFAKLCERSFGGIAKQGGVRIYYKFLFYDALEILQLIFACKLHYFPHFPPS